MRVLSGIQPSGTVHLGNYYGYLKQNIDLLGHGEVFLMIADLHALTTVHDGEKLREFRENLILDFLACGFDPEKGTLFFQSDVAQHTELAWILNCVTPMGLLERAVSYKEKVQKGLEGNVGLFTYPVLQAADILLYDADTVPVGKDQKQHIEMARDIAQKFNNRYGEDLLIVPEPRIREEVSVIPGVDGQKMSKSYGNTIPVFGEEKEVKKVIMSIVTDSKDMNDPKDPDTCVIYQIHKHLLAEEQQKALADEYKNGLPYGEAKKRLLEDYLRIFGEMKQKRDAFAKNRSMVREVVNSGAKSASAVAEATLSRVKSAVGLA